MWDVCEVWVEPGFVSEVEKVGGREVRFEVLDC